MRDDSAERKSRDADVTTAANVCTNCDHGTDPKTLTTCNECEGTGVPTAAPARRPKVWLVLDRNDVAVLIGALESVFQMYSPAEVASGLVEDENRLWEALTEKLRRHDLGRR